jgi:hypothetical protein
VKGAWGAFIEVGGEGVKKKATPVPECLAERPERIFRSHDKTKIGTVRDITKSGKGLQHHV